MEIIVISEAPTIVSGTNTNIINSSNPTNTISVVNTINNVYSIGSTNSIAVINSAFAITSTSPSQVVVAASAQGPQGIQGPIGPTGGSAVTYTAPIALGGNRVITSAIIYADSSIMGTVGKAIGITTGSALLGTPVNIQLKGELVGFFGLTPDTPVYLSTLGNVTQVFPLSGYLQKLGMAITSTTILINISEPIVL